jgi:ferredoxin-type protein NapG
MSGRLKTWWTRARFKPQRRVGSRRRFLIQGAAALAAGVVLGAESLRESAHGAEHGGTPIRPPTADTDDLIFRSLCVRCGMCGTVCENGCIRFFGLDEAEHGAMTPFLDVRRRSCTLCMRCTQICPTGALTPVGDDLDVVAKAVDMGTAVVDTTLCLSYLGRVCGYCHDACPIPQHAIKLVPPAKPIIQTDGCVGCGRCVEECPQFPTAIRVVPSSEYASLAAFGTPKLPEREVKP